MTEDPKETSRSADDGHQSGRSDESTARRRADSLTSRKPGATDPEGKPGTSAEADSPSGDRPGRPALTEKQRIEARRARQARRRRRPVEGNPLSKGMRATGFEIRRTAAFIGSSIVAGLAALGPVFSAAGMGLVWLIERAGTGLKALGRLATRALASLGRAVVALDRVITPQRAALLVAAVAAVLLGISQYKGLGQIEIGQAGYTGFQDLARAPAIDHTTPAGVHTQILVPIAALAFAAVILVALGSLPAFAKRLGRFRRFASMLLVTIGLLTVVVALLVDLPDATDTTEASLAYAGVKAVVLSGFWLELAAGATLAATGIVLLFQPAPGRVRQQRRAGRTDAERANRPRRASGPATGSHA